MCYYLFSFDGIVMADLKLDNEQKILINEFTKVSGLNYEEALNILEAYEWNYNAAVSDFFDSSEEKENKKKQSNNENSKNLKIKKLSPPNKIIQVSKSNQHIRNSSNVMTFASLAKKEQEHSSGSDLSEEETQAFYAGGSINSGQQILAPNKNARGLVKEMKYLVGTHGIQTTNVSNATNIDSNVKNESSPQSRNVVEVNLKAWRNGFSVDDGPLRDYDDPTNEAFLDDIRQGRIPQELSERIFSSQEPSNYENGIHLSFEDHSYEDFKRAKQTPVFSGKGYRLGSPVPIPAPISAPTQSAGDHENMMHEAKGILNTDETQPVTAIQVRLSDGSKLYIRVNYHHTLSDIKRYIIVARPEYAGIVFTLMDSSTYPMSEITNDQMTVQNANLFNALLVQHVTRLS